MPITHDITLQKFYVNQHICFNFNHFLFKQLLTKTSYVNKALLCNNIDFFLFQVSPSVSLLVCLCLSIFRYVFFLTCQLCRSYGQFVLSNISCCLMYIDVHCTCIVHVHSCVHKMYIWYKEKVGEKHEWLYL